MASTNTIINGSTQGSINVGTPASSISIMSHSGVNHDESNTFSASSTSSASNDGWRKGTYRRPAQGKAEEVVKFLEEVDNYSPTV
jgi:hypothetical protein